MYMLILVLDDTSHLNQVLQAWRDAGVKGVTIIESTGINRILPREVPNSSFMGFSRLLGSGSVGHQTLFAVIDSMEVADTAVAAAETVLGDLNEPHTGIVFAVPVVKTWGILGNDQ